MCVLSLAAFCSLPGAARADSSEPDLVEQIEVEPAEPASDSGDVVEVIDDGSGVASPAPSVPPPPMAAAPASVDRLELRGWARQSLELGFADDVLHADEPDAYALPYDALVARTQLFVRAGYSHARWFEVSVSGLLGYSIYEQSPADPSATFNGLNGQATRGVIEPRLGELYVGLYTSALDLRIGQQRVAWGRSEFLSPNDLLNARDGRDPFVGETELRVQPTLLVRADLDLGFGTLQGVFAPAYVPDRFDTFGSNWAGIQPDAPPELRGMISLLQRSIDVSTQEPAQLVFASIGLPSSNFSQPTAGARFAWSAGSLDVSHYYHYGFDGPFVQIDPRVFSALAATDFATAGLADLEPLLRMIDAGQQPIRIDYVRRHHVGLDAATTVGPFALRLDVAYQSRRSYFQRDFVSVTSPAIQGVIALEYQTGEPDQVILVEAMYMRVLDELPAPLLIWSRNSAGLGGLLRWPLWGGLKIELRALIGIQPLTQVLQPQLDLDLGNWTASLGALWLGGEAYSFGQYFHRNRELYAKLKVSF